MPETARRAYDLATAAPRFPKEWWQGGASKAENLPVDQLYATVDANSDAGRSLGSNNWVIAGSRTTTGRPILANDPHRPVGVPSLRYIAHLEAPGLSIIGAGEPALPGVSFGHNADAAFGLTIFYIDQEDLYAYQTQGDAYRYKGGLEPMKVVRETIEVKGEAPREVELHYTRHGPVVWQDQAKGQAFAIRTIWNQPGLAGYFGSSRMWRAKGWDDFQTARDKWGAPPLNLVYADAKRSEEHTSELQSH